MLENVSFDQLRIFLAAVDEGSFSAAARRVRRTQSAVSEAIANLENQLDVLLFDRGGRYPKLTTEGAVLLSDARAAIAAVDGLRARAKGISGGLEAELSVVVDVFLPISMIADAAQEFRLRFPNTPLRLYVEALGGAVQPVLSGSASIGVVGSLPTLPDGLTKERITEVAFAMVASKSHPLAAMEGVIPAAELARHVQLVLTDRSTLSEGRQFGVMSPLNWRLADLFAKHAFLVSGLGWGGMPMHSVRNDIDEGRLVELRSEDVPPGGLALPMFAIYRNSEPPGPAGRWLIDRLKSNSSTKAAN